jgi:hypothetical protein
MAPTEGQATRLDQTGGAIVTMHRRGKALLAGAVTALGILVAPAAAAADTPPSAQQCGLSQRNGNEAWWTACSTANDRVRIELRQGGAYDKCVEFGHPRYIGQYVHIWRAYRVGGCPS